MRTLCAQPSKSLQVMNEIAKYAENFLVIAVSAIVVRIVAFGLVMLFPIHSDNYNLVSPLIEHQGMDKHFYQKAADQYKTIGMSILYSKTEVFYKNPTTEYSGMSALPLFPLILIIFDYEQGNTIPLALAYLFFCCLMCLIWLRWLKDNGCSTLGLWLFIIVPNPIYYMLAIGTDLPFAVIFSVFFTTYFTKNKNNYMWIAALILLCLLRPNSISIGLFVILDQFLRGVNIENKLKLPLISVMALGVTIIGIFSLPYFVVYLDLSRDFTYFGVSNKEYIDGIFPKLPYILDKFLSIIVFLFAKLLYFCGLRPSYNPDLYLPLVFLRSFVGIFLLPGIIYIFLSNKWQLKQLTFLYILPFFMGATQDRYHLAIFPILYFYGLKQYEVIWKIMRKKFTLELGAR